MLWSNSILFFLKRFLLVITDWPFITIIEKKNLPITIIEI